MVTCPVCEQQTKGLLCPACGYDASQNREAYPTLAPIPTEIKAISTLKATWLARHQDLIRCPGCGGLHFTLNQKNRAITCISCNTSLSESKKSPLYPPRPATAPTAPTALKTLRPFLTGYIPPEGCHVVATGDNYQGCCNVGNWQNIVALSVSDFHTAGLKNDGTVVTIGNRDHQECETGRWEDIVDVKAETFYTYGLKADGRILFTGDHPCSKMIESWTDLQSITCCNFHLSGLRKNGTVVTTNSSWKAVNQWTNMKAIAATKYTLFGLDWDGTVKTADRSSVLLSPKTAKFNVQNWKDITAIATGEEHAVGLRRDGTVVASGDNSNNQCAVSSWNNIVAIAAGGKVTAGVRADGTVVCTNPDLDVSQWKRIISVAVSEDHIVALRLTKEQYAAQLHFKE